MKAYIANIDGWVAGQRVARGDLVVLGDAQAQYEPVTPVQMPVQTPAPAPAPTPREMGPVTPPSTGLKPRRKSGGPA